MTQINWTHYLRRFEIDFIITFIRNIDSENKESKILEIGCGDGYGASILRKDNLNVKATDPTPRHPLQTEVICMEVENLKFKDDYFDVIYSTHVLEHVDDITIALGEMNRVLKNEGIMIHSVPTVFCALFTLFVNSLAYFRNLFMTFIGKNSIVINRKNIKKIEKILLYLGRIIYKFHPIRILFPVGHGQSNSVFSSLMMWKRKSWISKFEKCGMTVKFISRVPIAYSMHKVFPFRFIGFRKVIGRYFGSVDIYIIKKDIDV